MTLTLDDVCPTRCEGGRGSQLFYISNQLYTVRYMTGWWVGVDRPTDRLIYWLKRMPNGLSAQSAIWGIRIPYRKVGILSFELHSMRFQDSLRQPESQRKKVRPIFALDTFTVRKELGRVWVLQHRLNMELDLSPKFIWAPCAQLCSLAETPQLSPSLRIWAHIYIRERYWSGPR